MSKKISELEVCEKINEQSSLPILCDGETMRLSYKTLVEDLKKILNFSNFSGNYEDLENKPEIPSIEGLASKEYVNNMISDLSTLDILVVNSLPNSDISTSTIYLLAKENSEDSNVYDEYIYVLNRWEKIGDTKVDLTNYVNKQEVNTLVKGYIDGYFGDIETIVNDINGTIGISLDEINGVEV